VKYNLAIRRLLATLVIAGLVLAPISQPVMAKVSADVAMQAMTDAMSPSAMTDEMASEMPCCPSKALAPVDCDECVLMAGCMSKCFTGMSASVFHPFPIASDRLIPRHKDARPDGLGRPPPEHPPRTLV
jgi:hypothetical protein